MAKMSPKFHQPPEQTVLTQCFYCTQRDPDAPRSICPAYPKGIPDTIITNQIDHRRVLPGQTGHTVFTPDPRVNPDALANLYRVLDKAE